MGMAGYTKLFSSILASTIWREDDKTRIVWITLLAMSDKDGIADGSVPGLADFARVSVDDCRAALNKLASPDPDSRSKEYEGRRIEIIDGGWRILNHAKYRSKLNEDERREYLRKKQAEHRAKSGNVNTASTSVNKCQQTSTPSTHSDADADADPFQKGGVGENGEVPNADPAPKAPASTTEPHPKTEPPPAVQWQPTEMQKRFNRFFNRRDTTPWNKKEIAALRALGEIEPEVLATTERYYAAKLPKDGDYRRHDLLTLLNNWNGECDRARRYRPTNCL